MAAQRSSAAVRTAAPQREVPVRPNKHATIPHLVPPPRQTPRARKQSRKRTAAHMRKIFVLSVCMLLMLSALIFERAKLIQLNSEKAQIEQQLDTAKSETVRLEALFNSKVSVDSVEEYAKNKLGMVKRQKYQVHFFRNENEDEIVLLDPADND